MIIIKFYKKSAFVRGDFNINVVKINNTTLVYHILTNNIDETVQSKSGLLVNDISDHKINSTYQINSYHKIKKENSI